MDTRWQNRIALLFLFLLGGLAGLVLPVVGGGLCDSVNGFMMASTAQEGVSERCPGGSCYSNPVLGPGLQAAFNIVVDWGLGLAVVGMLIAILMNRRFLWKGIPSLLLGWSIGTLVLRETLVWFFE